MFTVGAVTAWSAPAAIDPGSYASDARSDSGVAAAPAVASLSGPASGGAPNYRAIVAQNQAAVVGITTASDLNVSASSPSGDGDQSDHGENDGNPFNRLFPNMPRSRAMPMHTQGSGFIVGSDGLILTNAHVVDGAKQVTVRLSDHREFRAKVLGADKTSDIAVLRIDAHGLPTVQIGNADQLAVGDYVLAIGEPFGLEETATAGIVSAKGRSLPGDGYVPFIQTDAAVNPGNSGGPLFNAAGQVVGINSQIYSNSGGYQGVAFAIPINLAEQVKDQIVATGTVTHGRLGVEVQNVDQSLADAFRLKSPAGALVSTVEPGSAAAHADIKAGDVILEFNHAAIRDAGQLSADVNMTPPGAKAIIELWRQGEALTVTARVGSAADLAAAAQTPDVQAQTSLGLSLRPLRPQERDLADGADGLVVENAHGRAAEAGIQRGDVVLSVDGTPVQNVAQLRELVRKHDKQIALLIQRGESRIFIPISIG
jgi:serine protease Do